jgi:beta-glucosidase
MTLPEKAAQMQNTAPAIPRLNIPDYDWWNEALHGVDRAGLATSFPQAIALAATWNPVLLNSVASAISTEARAIYNNAQLAGDHSRYHGLTFWSPNINILRDPRWGRAHETYGEDPFLTSQMAVAFITGMQGDDPRYLKTVATAKHFDAHSGPEPLRLSFNALASPEDLASTYLPAFQAATSIAGAASVMCSYNAINGIPACANSTLLQSTLRTSWSFPGYVVSDCGAITAIYSGHHFTNSLMAASASAVLAGTDLSCGDEYSTLPAAISAGLLTEADLDRSLVRLFTARFRLGMFDPPALVPYASIPFSAVDSPANRSLALQAALESIVLLKNSILPLDPQTPIAIVGPAADAPDMQLADYHGTPSHIVTPLAALQARFANSSYAPGSTYTPTDPALVPVTALSLTAQYFPNSTFSVSPTLTRPEPRVYFNWDSQDPAVVSAVPRNQFSIRWTGSLTAPYTGAYQLGILLPECSDCTGSDGATLLLDGHALTTPETPVTWPQHTQLAPVQLQAGSTHTLEIDYTQTNGHKGIELVWIPPADALLNEAVQLTSHSSAAILCIGLNGDLESEQSTLDIPGFLDGDRTTLQLPDPQQQLLNALLGTGKPVIVVLMSGGSIVAAGAQEQAAAILQAWYPGQEGGAAIAQVLAGDYNPAGRLPATFYQSVDDLPAFTDYGMANRTYRFYYGQPLYGFGYGLSYSTFVYSGLHIQEGRVSARIANTSMRDGEEVAQLYIAQPPALPQLTAFRRIAIAAGSSTTVEFALPKLVGPAIVSIGGGQPVPGNGFVQGSIGLRYRKPR